MRRISTALIDKQNLFSEGMRGTLVKAGFSVVALAEDYNNFGGLYGDIADINLIIICSRSDPEFMEKNIVEFRIKYPSSKIVVLSEDDDTPTVCSAFNLSASGFLLKNINFTTLIKSLELIMLGENVFPATVLKEVNHHDHGVELQAGSEVIAYCPPQSDSHRALSTREMQILKCLIEGQSNKVIARQLEIGEATVKVHIKAILRKIRVRNRTQAAIWAVSHLETPAPDVALNGTALHSLDPNKVRSAML